MKYFQIIIACTIFSSCSNNIKEQLVNNIKTLETQKEYKLSDSLVNTYIAFGKQFPEDSNAIKYTFKAAEILIKNNQLVKGAKLYESIAKDNSSPLAAEALLRAGVCYESIPDKANAVKIYEQFIAQFPTHERIEEVKKMKEYAGLTDEELFKRLLENKENAN